MQIKHQQNKERRGRKVTSGISATWTSREKGNVNNARAWILCEKGEKEQKRRRRERSQALKSS